MREEILKILEKAGISGAEVFMPEHESQGHYSTNVALRLAKQEKKNPLDLARELAEKIKKSAPAGFFEKVEAAPPGFINFWISPITIQDEFARVLKNLEDFGKSDIGKGKTVIVEYSQPNIAKKMHVGHLRTTIIGAALADILENLGYKVIRWNYLGDWGTQFGKLIAAYKLWGDEESVKADPINALQKLYVRFHDELKSNAELDKKGQEEFKKLEEGDKENRKLWEWFKNESLKEFQKTYKQLGVKFDTEIGESFYEKDIKSLVARLRKDGIAKESEGALIIPLDRFDKFTAGKYNLPPALIQKSDGASLYLTRDIANLEYRIKKYKPAKVLYVVGNEQSLHFEQLFAIADILGLRDKVELIHAKYGLVLGEEGKKLATREGRAVLLENVLDKALKLAREAVDAKNVDLPEDEKQEVAEAVGIGALKYGILKENRNTDITFNWKQMLSLAGDSAPYLQYSYARLRSILRKVESEKRKEESNLGKLGGDAELRVMRKLFEFPDEVARSGEILETNNLASYLYELAALVSRFYETTPVMKEENAERRAALLALIDAAASVLKSGMNLLGIRTPERI
ncbi:MAG: arginine--tRNA ligase [Patescibacteria group bacterium]